MRLQGMPTRPPLIRSLRQGSPDGFDETLAEFHAVVDGRAAAQLPDVCDPLLYQECREGILVIEGLGHVHSAGLEWRHFSLVLFVSVARVKCGCSGELFKHLLPQRPEPWRGRADQIFVRFVIME